MVVILSVLHESRFRSVCGVAAKREANLSSVVDSSGVRPRDADELTIHERSGRRRGGVNNSTSRMNTGCHSFQLHNRITIFRPVRTTCAGRRTK